MRKSPSLDAKATDGRYPGRDLLRGGDRTGTDVRLPIAERPSSSNPLTLAARPRACGRAPTTSLSDQFPPWRDEISDSITNSVSHQPSPVA
jgi:hypothetical protein